MSATVILLDSIGGIGLLVTAAGAVGGSWRLSRNNAIVGRYREAAQAWEVKSKAQDAEIDELKRVNTEQEKHVAELSARVAVLQDVVTGKVTLDLLDQRTTQLVGIANSNAGLLTKLTEAVTANSDLLKKLVAT